MKILNEYSSDFPLQAIPNILSDKWKFINKKLKDKIEKWYFSIPMSTMKESFKEQPLKFLNEIRIYNRKRNEFSSYVDAHFKGGIIERPLLDAQFRNQYTSLGGDMKKSERQKLNCSQNKE